MNIKIDFIVIVIKLFQQEQPVKYIYILLIGTKIFNYLGKVIWFTFKVYPILILLFLHLVV